jgi:hypothetical protein
MFAAAMNRSFCFSFVHLPSAMVLSPLLNTDVQHPSSGQSFPTFQRAQRGCGNPPSDVEVTVRSLRCPRPFAFRISVTAFRTAEA